MIKNPSGIKIKLEKDVKIVITLSLERAEAIRMQFDEIAGGELDEVEFGDLKDFIDALDIALGDVE